MSEYKAAIEFYDDKKWWIYGLVDPFTGTVRYIGITNNLKRRQASHRCTARKRSSYRDNWIKTILDRGLKPFLMILEAGFGRSWCVKEQYWISHYRKLYGDKITNLTNGGDGTRGTKVSNETRLKMSSSKKGIPQTKEVITARFASRWANPRPKKTSMPSLLYKYRTKSVLCVDTGEIFSSLRLVCDKYGCDSGSLSKAIRRKTKCKGYYWSFNLTDSIQDMDIKRSRCNALVNLNTGIEYKSITSAAKSINCDRKMLSKSVKLGLAVNDQFFTYKI